jgi:hypothetical protein
VTFTVPAGFSYQATTEGTSRIHVMKNGPAGVVLAVLPVVEATCQATFVTAHGLPGCAKEEVVQGGLRAAIVLRGGVLAAAVLATVADGSALQLARAVADSVVIPASSSSRTGKAATPGIDERFFGCFSSGSYDEYVSTALQMCLNRDRTFRYRSMVRVATRDPFSYDESASALGDFDESGAWSVEPFDARDGNQHWYLHLTFGDGREATWEVRFYNGDLVRGDTDLWERR